MLVMHLHSCLILQYRKKVISFLVQSYSFFKRGFWYMAGKKKSQTDKHRKRERERERERIS